MKDTDTGIEEEGEGRTEERTEICAGTPLMATHAYMLTPMDCRQTVCEFIATVESRQADSFLSRGYVHNLFLSDSLRLLAATSKRFYYVRNGRQF